MNKKALRMTTDAPKAATLKFAATMAVKYKTIKKVTFTDAV
jgi:hypothetical protein